MSEFPWEKPRTVDSHRSIPNSVEAEQGVLGCMLLSPNECINECIERLKPGAEALYDIRHKVIYSVLVEMFEAKEAIDVITVQQKLKSRQKLDDVGGLTYLAGLPDTVPSAANLSFYINIVIEKFLLRQMFNHGNATIERIYSHSSDLGALIDEFEAGAMAVRNAVQPVTDSSIKEMVMKRIDFYEECERRGGALMGLSTGYPDLDKMTDGLKAGDMIVLAARPSMGKTSLAMNIAENVAIDQNIPVGIFSLEMSGEALVGRMISSRGRVNERNLTSAKTNEQEKKNTFTGAVKVSKAPIHIDDRGGLTISQLRAKARRMVQRHGVKLFVIDYVQLLRTSRPKANRQEEIAEISTGIKAMAKELRVPIIAICQLNRELERDKERKPRTSDLRESGQIEQDADVIGMLYAANPEEAMKNPDVLRVNLLIAKQRNGPTGDVQLLFNKQFTRFESVSRVEFTDPPKSWIPPEE